MLEVTKATSIKKLHLCGLNYFVSLIEKLGFFSGILLSVCWMLILMFWTILICKWIRETVLLHSLQLSMSNLVAVSWPCWYQYNLNGHLMNPWICFLKIYSLSQSGRLLMTSISLWAVGLFFRLVARPHPGRTLAVVNMSRQIKKMIFPDFNL